MPNAGSSESISTPDMPPTHGPKWERLIPLGLLLLTGCGHKSTGVLLEFINPNPVCGAVITEPCAQSMTVTDVTENTAVLGTPKLEGPDTESTYTIEPLPAKTGKHTYQVVLNGTNQQGEKGTSPITAQFETTVTIP